MGANVNLLSDLDDKDGVGAGGLCIHFGFRSLSLLLACVGYVYIYIYMCVYVCVYLQSEGLKESEKKGETGFKHTMG